MKNLFLLALLALGACAAPQPVAQLEPVYCTGKNDCDVKWGRALTWVQGHSAYTLNQATDMLISTNGPLPDATDAAYTVTKVPLGHGRYQIHFNARAANIVWGCAPSCYSQAVDFRAAVTGRD